MGCFRPGDAGCCSSPSPPSLFKPLFSPGGITSHFFKLTSSKNLQWCVQNMNWKGKLINERLAPHLFYVSLSLPPLNTPWETQTAISFALCCSYGLLHSTGLIPSGNPTASPITHHFCLLELGRHRSVCPEPFVGTQGRKAARGTVRFCRT